MYKLNNNFKLFQIFAILVFVSNTLFSFAAEEKLPDLQVSNLTQESLPVQPKLQDTDAINDDELPESDITTKIYRSTDSSNEALDGIESELDPSLDLDVINKEDLINMHSHLKNKIIKREKSKDNANIKKLAGNVFLPWLLFAVILVLLLTLMKIIKQVKI